MFWGESLAPSSDGPGVKLADRPNILTSVGTGGCVWKTDDVKVVHVIDSLGGGGGAEHALRLQLPELARRGVDSTVVSLRARSGPLLDVVRAEGTPVHVLDGVGRTAGVRELRRHIQAFRPDLVHATLFNSCLASRLGTPRGLPLLNSLVSTSYARVRVDRLSDTKWKRAAVRVVDATTARRVDWFHAITWAVAAHAHDALRIPMERITVIPRGRSRAAMGERSPERRARVRRELGIGDSVPIVLNVGRQEPPKAQASLIRAFRDVRQVVPHAVLLMVGREGGSTGEIQQAIREGGADRHVRVLGYRTDVADILAASDLFVFPSWYEGLGSALIEAMAMKLPVVASDIPAIREVLDKGRAGVLVPPGDRERLAEAIVTLLQEPADRARLGERGYRRFIDHYELGHVVDQTIALYESVAARSR